MLACLGSDSSSYLCISICRLRPRVLLLLHTTSSGLALKYTNIQTDRHHTLLAYQIHIHPAQNTQSVTREPWRLLDRSRPTSTLRFVLIYVMLLACACARVLLLDTSSSGLAFKHLHPQHITYMSTLFTRKHLGYRLLIHNFGLEKNTEATLAPPAAGTAIPRRSHHIPSAL